MCHVLFPICIFVSMAKVIDCCKKIHFLKEGGVIYLEQNEICAMYCIVSNRIAPFCIVLHCTVLSCIIL